MVSYPGVESLQLYNVLTFNVLPILCLTPGEIVWHLFLS